MNIFKNFGLVLLGALLMFGGITQYNFNKRLVLLEKNNTAIINYLNQQEQLKKKQPVVMPPKPLEETTKK